MGYRGYFTMSVVAFLVFGILVILNVILYFKFDIKNIIKVFIRKLKVVVFILLPIVFVSGDVSAAEETSAAKGGCEIRFKTRTYSVNDMIYYPDLGEEYFSFFVKAVNPEITDTVSVYVDEVLCFRSLSGDRLDTEIPIVLKKGYEPGEIVVVNRAKSGNSIRSVYKLEKDSEGPYIDKNSIEVSDTKGVIGINKRLKAFITGEDTVTVKIKNVSDVKSGINSLYFKYYTKNAEHTIKGDYDRVTGEYYAVLNLPKNAKREFFVITRDNLFNISATEEELINIITDNTSPELEIAKDGNYYEKDEEIVFKNKMYFEIKGKDQVGIKDISVYINDTEFKKLDDIISDEGGLVKEYNFTITEQNLNRGETTIKISVRNYGGYEVFREIKVYSDNSKPTIIGTYVNSFFREIEEDSPDFFDNKETEISLVLKDFDDANIDRNEINEISLCLYDVYGNLIDQREIYRDKDGKTSFKLRCDFKGYGVIRAKDIFSNEMIFKTGIFVLESEDTFKQVSKIEFKNKDNEISDKNIDVPILVKSDFSGIKEVKYKVSSLSDVKENKVGTLEIKGKTENGYIIYGEGVVTVTNNSNDIKLLVELISNCGNFVEEYITLNIDRTYPVINLEFLDGKEKHYINHDRVLKIEIIERNFNRNNLSLSIIKNGINIGNKVEFKTQNDPNPDKIKHISFVEFKEEGEYSVFGAVRDMAGNTVSLREESFIIDKTPPKGEIIFDNKIPDNGFLNTKINAKIKITDTYLDLDSIVIKGVNTSRDKSFKYENGIYETDITFDKSGEFEFFVSCKDMAENLSNELSSDKFILDLTTPEILIFNLTNNKSYNNDFSFSGEIVDEYLDFKESKVSLKKETTGENLVLSYLTSSDKISFSIEKMEKLPENDGIYELIIIGKDLAGNTIEKTVKFSINRFGSTFIPSKELEEISNAFTRVLGSVDIVEINYDEINPLSTRVFLFRNGNTRLLNMESDYEISSSNNGFLNSLTYSINKDNFSEDGIYAISIYSKDKAGNTNLTNRDESLISFVVDRTPPRIYSLNLSSNDKYNRPVDMEIKAFDNMKLDGVFAYNNDVLMDLEKKDDKYILHLPLSNKKNNIKLCATDSAGNYSETRIDNIVVGYKKSAEIYDILTKITISVLVTMSIIILLICCKWRSYGKRKNRRTY